MLHSSLRKQTPSVTSNKSLHFDGPGASTSEGEYMSEYNRASQACSFFAIIFLLGCISCVCIHYAILAYSFPEYNDALLINIRSKILPLSLCGTAHPKKIVEDIEDLDGIAESMNDHEHHYEICPVLSFTLKNMFVSNLGQGVGAVVGGILGDLYGRRFICLWMLCPWTLAVLFLLIPSTAFTYQAILFCLNIPGGAWLCLLFVNLMEILHKKHRVCVMYLPYTMFIALTLLACDLKHRLLRWNACQYFNILNLNVLAFSFWYIPESPRWLWNKGKKEKAFEILKELTDVVDCQLISVPNVQRPGTSWEILKGMVGYLKRRRMQCYLFIVICLLSIMNGVLYSVPKFKGYYIEYEKWSDYKYVRISAWLLSMPFTIPIYFCFGLRYGQLFVYMLYAIASLIMIFISRSTIVALVYNFAAMVFSLSGSVMLFWCVVETYPTFMRATMLGVCFTSFQLVHLSLMASQDIWPYKMSSNQMHICLCVVSVLGLLVLFVPRQSMKKDLPNQKL